MKVCASCKPEENLNDTSFSVSLPQWLKQTNFVKNFVQSMNPIQKITKTTTHFLYEIEFHPSMNNKLILLWATIPSNSLEIKDAKNAYHHFENHQIGKVSKNGKLKVFLKIPQLYYVLENNKKVVYPRHFHFVIRDKDQWNPQVYTHIITPVVDRTFVKKRTSNQNAIIVNTLPPKIYSQTKINKNVLNLSEEIISKKNKNYWRRKLLSFIEKNYSNIFLLIKSKHLKLENVPIIVYCKNTNCKSSEKWIEKMLEFGYYNLYHYEAGFDNFVNSN
jgi:hypothetical protein